MDIWTHPDGAQSCFAACMPLCSLIAATTQTTCMPRLLQARNATPHLLGMSSCEPQQNPEPCTKNRMAENVDLDVAKIPAFAESRVWFPVDISITACPIIVFMWFKCPAPERPNPTRLWRKQRTSFGGTAHTTLTLRLPLIHVTCTPQAARSFRRVPTAGEKL